MSPREEANAKTTFQFDFLWSSRNKSSNRNSSETPQIPELLDENGDDLLSGESNSGERPAVKWEWSSDTLRKLDRFWRGSARSRLPSFDQTGGSSVRSGLPNRSSPSRAKWSLTVDTDLTEYMTTPDDLHRFRDREESPSVISRNVVSRFYKPELVGEELLGPENYKDWVVRMEEKLRQCGRTWEFDADIMLALVYSEFSTQWAKVNSNVWMMIFSNVSKQIKRALSALEILDAREAWQFLEKTCGGDVPLRIRSVKGVRDIMSIKYDECASLKEYIDKMMLCIRAIECNPCGEKERYRHCGANDDRGGKRFNGEDNEWLWCQFILVNLGQDWEAWVFALIEKYKGGEQIVDAISTFRRLFPIIEAEEARRIQGSRYTKRCEE